jgi:hypothetical protein
VSLAAIGSVFASCAFDPRHPNAECNDVIVQSDDGLMLIAFIGLFVILVGCGLLTRALWRRHDRARLTQER